MSAAVGMSLSGVVDLRRRRIVRLAQPGLDPCDVVRSSASDDPEPGRRCWRYPPIDWVRPGGERAATLRAVPVPPPQSHFLLRYVGKFSKGRTQVATHVGQSLPFGRVLINPDSSAVSRDRPLEDRSILRPFHRLHECVCDVVLRSGPFQPLASRARIRRASSYASSASRRRAPSDSRSPHAARVTPIWLRTLAHSSGWVSSRNTSRAAPFAATALGEQGRRALGTT
jgi:hypothetical protein